MQNDKVTFRPPPNACEPFSSYTDDTKVDRSRDPASESLGEQQAKDKKIAKLYDLGDSSRVCHEEVLVDESWLSYVYQSWRADWLDEDLGSRYGTATQKSPGLTDDACNRQNVGYSASGTDSPL